MGWLRLVGSLKLQDSNAKEPYKRDNILQKRPTILRGLLIIATPYRCIFAFLYYYIRMTRQLTFEKFSDLVYLAASWLLKMCHFLFAHVCEMTHSCVWHDLFILWHDLFICVTWLIYMCDMTHSYVWHDSFMCVTWLIHMCDMTHSNVWHDSFICVTWLIHMWHMTHSYVWHDSFICVTWLFICVTWLIHMCDMTHSYVWHDLFVCVTWPIQMCDTTHSYVWHHSFICVTWLIHICDMTHSHVWHDSFICATWLIHIYDMTHTYVWHDSFTCVPLSCFTKLVSFCKMTPEQEQENASLGEFTGSDRKWKGKGRHPFSSWWFALLHFAASWHFKSQLATKFSSANSAVDSFYNTVEWVSNLVEWVFL